MKNNPILSFFGWVKKFFQNLSNLFSYREKMIIVSAMIILIVTGALLIYDNYTKTTTEVARSGGVYREGIVAKDASELVGVTNRLTKIGLTRFDNDGNIIPCVAQSWEISEDVKNYIFIIKSDYDRDFVIKELEKQIDKWPNISIKAQDDDKIIFSFPDPYSPFLASTTEPVLSFGAYVLQKDMGSELVFVRNDEYKFQKPYLDKIVIKIYPDFENLHKAYNAHQIDGSYMVVDESAYKLANFYTFKLPRYNMMFFNTQREALSDKEIRRKIKNFEPLDNPLTLNLVSLESDKFKAIIEELEKKYADINLSLNVYYKSPGAIINDIIPTRDYDILIYGLDYGDDPDPYPFWHSTQSGETGYNLSNFSHIDADIALEEARKTLDENVRREKYDQFWEIFDDEVPAIVLSQDEWRFAVSDKFKGVSTGWSIAPEDRFLKVTDWYTKTKRVKN